jgi:hypothetical protein
MRVLKSGIALSVAALGAVALVALSPPASGAGANEVVNGIPLGAEEVAPGTNTLTNEQATRVDRVIAVGSKYGDAFGGAWFSKPEGGVIIGIKIGTSSSEALTKATAKSVVRVQAVDFTLTELSVGKATLRESLPTDGSVRSISIDERSNGLALGVEKSSVADVAASVASPAQTYAVGSTPDVPVTRIDVVADDGGFVSLGRQNDTNPYSGGIGWATGSLGGGWNANWLTCSMGYSMARGSSRFMVTAGHCTKDGFQPPQSRTNVYIRNGSGLAYDKDIATTSPTTYPNTLCGHDAALFQATTCVARDGDSVGYVLDSGASNAGNIYYGKSGAGTAENLKDLTTTRKSVTSYQANRPTLGTPLCFSGAKTGLNCGFEVSDSDKDELQDPDGNGVGAWTTGLIATTGNYGSNPVPGDSGSPWFRDYSGGVTAVGILSSAATSSSADTAKLLSYSQNYNGALRITWIGSIMTNYGATVLTS